jgi:hypothetical protein
MKTQVHANNSFVKLKVYSKIYSSANYLKLTTDPKHQNYDENHSSLTIPREIRLVQPSIQVDFSISDDGFKLVRASLLPT